MLYYYRIDIIEGIYFAKSNSCKESMICHYWFFNHFSIRYVPDQYKSQQVCDETVDDCLAALKFVPDWFVTSKMIKILFIAFYTDENIF